MNVLNLPSADQFEDQIIILREIAGKLGVVDTIGSWKDVQAIVRRGQAEKYFTPGDALMANYRGKPQILDVIGIDHDTPTDTSRTFSMTVQFRDCLENIQFSPPQALYYASSGLAVGTHVFTIDSGSYSFITSLPIPEGGQVVISSWDDDSGSYVPTRVTTYAADRTTVIESSLSVSSSTGSATISPVNVQQRCRYGSNNYLESSIRQWLNNEQESFGWVPKTNFDRPPISANYNGGGFLKVVDPDLAAVIGAVDKQVGRNTVSDGGGQDLFSDKVFLLSQVEVYGGSSSAGDTTGETPYDYYSNLASGATTSALAGRIKLLNDSPRPWFLRTPTASRACDVRSVSPSGTISNYYAYNALGASPACCII